MHYQHRERTTFLLLPVLAGEFLEEAAEGLQSLDTRYRLDVDRAANFIDIIRNLPDADSSRVGEQLIVLCEHENVADNTRFNFTVIGNDTGTLWTQFLTIWPDEPSAVSNAYAFAEALTAAMHH
jgi:hypothetical protein